MSVRSRFLAAAVLGLGVTSAAWAQEPAPFGVDRSQSLAARAGVSENQRVANTIAHHLRHSGQLHKYQIDIAFQSGVADLSGTVADQMQREEALRIVQAIPGVERVHDRLTLASASLAITQVHQNQPPANPQEPGPLPRKSAEPVPSPLRHGAPGAVTEPMPIYQAVPPGPYDVNQPKMPPYAWPTYAPYNNYSRVATPTLYPYNAWPNIGPVYPFPKIPLGWRKVKLEWQDGHWWYSRHSNSHDWWRLRYW